MPLGRRDKRLAINSKLQIDERPSTQIWLALKVPLTEANSLYPSLNPYSGTLPLAP